MASERNKYKNDATMKTASWCCERDRLWRSTGGYIRAYQQLGFDSWILLKRNLSISMRSFIPKKKTEWSSVLSAASKWSFRRWWGTMMSILSSYSVKLVWGWFPNATWKATTRYTSWKARHQNSLNDAVKKSLPTDSTTCITSIIIT